MEKLNKMYKDKDVVFLLVDYTEKRQVFADWIKANKVGLHAAHDANGNLLAKRFKVESLPTMYIIGRDKTIALSMKGGAENKESLDKKAAKIKTVIKALLAEDEQEDAATD